jgi:phenylalanyl-tRNA synthetase beta chain
VRVANPMSEDHSHLRTTLLGSLLDAARHNIARGMHDLALFESGAIYLDRGPADDAATITPDGDPVGPVLERRDEGLPLERHALGAILLGQLEPASHADREPRPWDYFATKGVLGAVLETLRLEWDVRLPGQPFLHPGRAARVFSADTEVGWLGEVHPAVAEAWDIDVPVAAFEVDLSVLVELAPETPQFRAVPAFPAVHQDLAIAVGDQVPSATVLDVVRASAGRLLERVDVFDVYRGAQVGEGRVSLALHLVFRAPDRTLTEDEVRALVDKAVAALAAEVGAEQRA